MFHFIRGLTYPFQGAKFLRNYPVLLKYILIPFLINVVLFSFLAFISWHYGKTLLNQAIPKGEAWYWSLLFYLSLGFLVLVLVLLVIFTFTVVGNLISAPFNDILSEKTEEIFMGKILGSSFPDPGFFEFSSLLRWASFHLGENLKEITFFVGIGLFIFFLNLIPVLGVGLSALWTWTFLAFEFLNYPLGRRSYSFRQKLHTIWNHKGLALGCGLGVFLVLLIPFFNLICIPISVVGGTLLYLQEMKNSK
jgi:CysZ protein